MNAQKYGNWKYKKTYTGGPRLSGPRLPGFRNTGISQYRDWKKGAISSIFLKIIFSENAKEVDEEEQESVSSTAFKIPYGVRFEKRQVTQNMDH